MDAGLYRNNIRKCVNVTKLSDTQLYQWYMLLLDMPIHLPFWCKGKCCPVDVVKRPAGVKKAFQ